MIKKGGYYLCKKNVDLFFEFKKNKLYLILNLNKDSTYTVPGCCLIDIKLFENSFYIGKHLLIEKDSMDKHLRLFLNNHWNVNEWLEEEGD